MPPSLVSADAGDSRSLDGTSPVEVFILPHLYGLKTKGRCLSPTVTAVQLEADNYLLFTRTSPVKSDEALILDPPDRLIMIAADLCAAVQIEDESIRITCIDESVTNKRKRSSGCTEMDSIDQICEQVPLLLKKSRRNALVPNGADADIVKVVSLQFHMESVCFSPHQSSDSYRQISPLEKKDSHEMSNCDFDSDCNSYSDSSLSVEEIIS